MVQKIKSSGSARNVKASPTITRAELMKAKGLKIALGSLGGNVDAEIETEGLRQFESGSMGVFVPWTSVLLKIGGKMVECRFQGTVVVSGSKNL